jgi:2-oxoglutarate ferredoxin oxidoreductase subunit beta
MIEEAIRYPGFAFVNIQSPCITYGEPEAQLKTQKNRMRKLAAEGHDATNRIRAMELAQEYGRTLYTGVFYRNPAPPPTYESLIRERQQGVQAKAPVAEEPLESNGKENGNLPAG